MGREEGQGGLSKGMRTWQEEKKSKNAGVARQEFPGWRHALRGKVCDTSQGQGLKGSGIPVAEAIG